MGYLSLQHINKIYPDGVQAVYDFNLEINEGEFIVLIGPSGCGKSTTLRMIAGLEGISSGDMFLSGERINNLAPSDRGVAMVFQDYALYGNMTVYQNIGFSLTVRRKSSDEIHKAVMHTAGIVHLTEYLNRYPKALSGGQKQRVAMGRSIAREARVLLMDEPLSNLDAKLRQETRKELAILHHELKPTIVYVTHDQIEAMTMATRIVVLKDGYIQQIGTPYQIYHEPVNLFTATFIGMPPMNVLDGVTENRQFTVLNKDKEPVLSFPIPQRIINALPAHSGVTMGIRAEHITGGEDHEYRINARVAALELLGAEYNATLDVKGVHLTSRISTEQKIKLGSSIDMAINVDKIHFFDINSGVRIA
ncbi:MAG: ABC transporter ATP-binding protein [Treponema sp.]|jgi:multiple sugar transport system ATP-binding protein|nr:ABC transporter ATP-binding protein [Treponema sp.]